jgi:ABC-type polysaccharide/polyol phosphate export permease
VVIGMAFLFRFLDPGSSLVAHPLALLSFVPTLLLLFVFAWSVAILAGFANVYFQDTQHLSEVGFQILFYMTPVCYPPELLRGKNLGFLVDFNPLAAFLDLVRQPILRGEMPGLFTYLTAAVTVAVLAGCAGLTLARKQQTLIFHL